MKLLVIGCGSIGKRHLRNLNALGIDQLVACDPDPNRLSGLSGQPGVCSLYQDYTEAFQRHRDVKAALICTPTNLHITPALFLAQQGVHLFIEKPLSDTWDGVDELVGIAKSNQIITMMGMCYRFHPGLLRIKALIEGARIGKVYSATEFAGQYLPDWQPDRDYRGSYTAQRALGGGVILSSIHSLDYARWLFGEITHIACYSGRHSDLAIDVEDMVSFTMSSSRGVLVEIHLDFLQRAKLHRMVVVGERGTIEWDFMANHMRILEPGKPAESIGYEFQINDMYTAELREFLSCVRTGARPAVDVEEGSRTLRLALTAKSASQRGSRLPVLVRDNDWIDRGSALRRSA